MDPKLRQKSAADYLGVSLRTFQSYKIPPKALPGRGSKVIQVWPVSSLDQFVEDHNNPRSRKHKRPEKQSA